MDLVLEKTHILDKKQIDPKRATKKSLHPEANVREVGPPTTIGSHSASKIFVGGLHPETTEKDLTDFFSRFDAIENATVMRDKSRNDVSRGFAFVTFRTQEGAERACVERFSELMSRRVILYLLISAI